MAYYLFLVVLKSISKYCNARPSQLLRIDRGFCIRLSIDDTPPKQMGEFGNIGTALA
jgi:hypothetical protein